MLFYNSKNQNALMRAHLTVKSTSFFFQSAHCIVHFTNRMLISKQYDVFFMRVRIWDCNDLQKKINYPPWRVSYDFYCHVINLHTAWKHKVGIFCLYLHLKIDSFIKYKYNPKDYWHHWAVLSTKQKSHWRAKERV